MKVRIVRETDPDRVDEFHFFIEFKKYFFSKWVRTKDFYTEMSAARAALVAMAKAKREKEESDKPQVMAEYKM
jgi:hypothetical protein